jgi:protein-arginine kinase
MQDTSIEMQRIYHDLLMSKTGEERFLMGISMFQIARELVLASFPKDLSEEQKRDLLMKRFYGKEIDQKAKNKKNKRLKTKG